jgi:hypothetical protein
VTTTEPAIELKDSQLSAIHQNAHHVAGAG